MVANGLGIASEPARRRPGACPVVAVRSPHFSVRTKRLLPPMWRQERSENVRFSKALLASRVLCLLMASSPVWASAARGVYIAGVPDANGNRAGAVHRVLVTGNTLKMQIGKPQTPDSPYLPGSGGYGGTFVAASNSPVASGYSICPSSYNAAPAAGVAVFNFQIYYAYTAPSNCSVAGSDMHVYVASFDPEKGAWVGIPRDVGKVQLSHASGAALAVIHGRLYLFTDSGTYNSVDPANGGWSMNGALAPTAFEPLDAVTVNPPDAPPRVLILYGQPTDHGYYSGLHYAVWDGRTFPANQMPTVSILAPVQISATGERFTAASLQTGTALGNSYYAWSGAKTPAIQLDAMTGTYGTGSVAHFEYTYNVQNGMWIDGWRRNSTLFASDATDLWTYSWYALRCDSTPPARVANQGIHQFLLVNVQTGVAGPTGYTFDSDYQVPQNKDPTKDVEIKACGDTGGHNNPTGAMTLEVAKHYWTLAGVVLGSPPFAMNDVKSDDLATVVELSNVDYASTTTTGVTHTQEWDKQVSLSAGLEVSAGFFEVAEVSNSFDIGYKHAEDSAHEIKSTTASALGQNMGTNAGGVLGQYGWALFNVPTINVQDWAIYAYDYNVTSGSGTYLKQDLTTIEPYQGGTTVKRYGFDLTDPSQGEIVGLMAGMTAFPTSQDLAGWHALEWESSTKPWTVVGGDGTFGRGETTLNPIQFGLGGNGYTQFAKDDEQVGRKGETTSLELSDQFSISSQTSFGGFRAFLKVGTESTFKTETSDSTGFSTDITATLKMISCGPDVVDKSKCIKSVDIQPFLLQATDSTAPWIPTGFSSQRPWCITWKVNSFCSETASTCATAAVSTSLAAATGAAPTAQGLVMGTSLPPVHASGRIVGGSGGGDLGAPLSHYSLEGGRLSWVHKGRETPIPMTADTFVPSKGVSLDISGKTWTSIGAAGGWTRSGAVWTFTSGGQVQQDRVLLSLDFGRASFNLQLTKVDFQGRIKAAVSEVPLSITVNGLYEFRTVLQHEFDITWQLNQPPVNNTRMQLTSFNGRYDKKNESGNMSLSGTLPAVLPNFGDLALEMNGRTLLLPLLSMDGFREAYEGRGVFKYVEKGLNLNLDFGRKTWSATFNNQAFQRLLALRWGGSRIAIRVGGTPWYNQENAVVNFTANLTLHN